MDYRDEMFVPVIRGWTDLRLRKDADPRLDRYYPKLIQSLARAGRVVRKVRHCPENHRLRRDLMLRLFDEEMEKMDLVSARFPDRHVHKFVDSKYVGLREYESDAEDYFACSEEKECWFDRAVQWYRPCE